MAYWLKALGTSKHRMTRHWVRDSPEDLRNIGFPRNPSVRVGDSLVYYGSGYGKVVGIVEVFMPPSLDNREAPWSYRCDVRPRIAIADIERGVELDALNCPASGTSGSPFASSRTSGWRLHRPAVASDVAASLRALFRHAVGTFRASFAA